MESVRRTTTRGKVQDETAEKVREYFQMFLDEYQQGHYIQQMELMRKEDRTTLFVDYEHVMTFNEVLGQAVTEEYYRFEAYLKKGLHKVMKDRFPDYAMDQDKVQKEFWISFYNFPAIHTMRDLKTTQIGQLISLTGTVTRTSEVRPELIFGTFTCEDCQTRLYDVEQQFKYTEPLLCPNPTCNNKYHWQLEVEQSKFIDWQKVRVQENSSEIPPGSMPRSIDVILRHEVVDRAKAGDKCIFTGTLIVVPDITQISVAGEKVQAQKQDSGRTKNNLNEGVIGMKSFGPRDLMYKMCFLACMVQPSDARLGTLNNTQYDNEDDVEKIIEQFAKHELEEISRMKHQPQLYSRLVNSIAPTVFGHDEIKRGILLMLFSGVHKKTKEGINLRGDINVCIVGDPSTSKSQFLKYVVNFLPRAVYTSGKASSAAGLTASVIKDEETGQFAIEAGALMLADNGICCIDEFDKMDIVDQVAIHEAMEQQTISIAKAGIRATLNARASILAAANPVDGRYNKTKSLKANVNMSAPIMSRFDLFFIILDEQDDTTDYNIARHILNLHQNTDEAITCEYSTEQLQRYIRFARTLKPQLTDESKDILVEQYKILRQSDAAGKKTSYRITVRQLESMIRLSEALARLHCDDEIKPKYVREAFRLLKKSIIHVETEDVSLSDEEEDLPFDPNATEPSVPMEIIPEQPQQTVAGEDVNETRKKKTISYETYHRIATALVMELRRHNESHPDGMKRSKIIEWYLGSKEDEINTEEELIEQQKLIKTILGRLVKKDNVLIELKQDSSDDPVLVVHPNYVVEQID